MSSINCGICKKFLPNHLRIINCSSCNTFFHVKCSGITHKNFNYFKTSNLQWLCQNCNHDNLQTTSHPRNAVVKNLDSNNQSVTSENKTNCGKCQNIMPEHLKVINCHTCGKYYHVKC